jgi:hypothetical protein
VPPASVKMAMRHPIFKQHSSLCSCAACLPGSHSEPVYLKEEKQLSITLPVPTVSETNNRKFLPFLGVENIPSGKAGAVLQIADVRVATFNGEEKLLLDVRLGESMYTFGVKFTSRNYAKLYGKFKGDTKTWLRGKFSVKIAEFEKDGETVKFLEVL